MSDEIQWIHPDEKMPESGQKVVVMDVVSGIQICTFLRTKKDSTIWVTDGKNQKALENVIGWIPWRG